MPGGTNKGAVSNWNFEMEPYTKATKKLRIKKGKAMDKIKVDFSKNENRYVFDFIF